MVTKADIERELRAEMPGTFDYQTEATKESLINTRLRDLGHLSVDKQPAPPANPPQRFGQVLTHVAANFAVIDPELLRQQLREALAAQKQAQDVVNAARNMAKEAQQRLSQCEEELTKFDGLEQRIADYDLDSLRSGHTDNLPAELTTALNHRSKAEDRFDRALVLRDRCNKELKQAESKLPDVNARVQHCINAIAVSELRRLVMMLDAVEEEVINTKTKIISLHLAGASVPTDITSRVFSEPPQLKPSADDKQAWADFMKRLHDDPDTYFD